MKPENVRFFDSAAEFRAWLDKRRRDSIWSTVNVKRMAGLMAEGRVTPAGMRAFEARSPERTGVYMNDMSDIELPDDLAAIFRANAGAWAFWNSTPAGYRRQMTWWVISAKRDETQRRRLEALIEEHAAGRRIDPLHMPKMSGR